MILFAAIAIPPHIAKDIARMQKGVAGAQWRTAEQLHITLGYFGDIDDDRAEELDHQLAQNVQSAFELSLVGGGSFGANEPYNIWAGISESAPLQALHRHCRKSAQRCAVSMEARKFRPHVTMAYLKSGAPIDRVIAFNQRMSKFQTRPFLVDEFALYSSHPKKKGSNLYRLEATYPLLGSRFT